MEINWDSYDNKTPLFSLDGYETEAKVVNIYDGDTVKLVFMYNNCINRWNCRIDGIDTPEIRSKNKKEKEMAKEARDKLRDLIQDKVVKVKCKNFDKYGRILIDLYTCDDICIKKYMLDNTCCKEYHGKTKEKWNFE